MSVELSESFKKKIIKKLSTPVKESPEDVSAGEYDYEGDMAKTQLTSIIRNSKQIIDILSDNQNLPEWVQSKITKAEDYISTVKDYMASETERNITQTNEGKKTKKTFKEFVTKSLKK
jgi:hypothetical protein